MFICNLAWDVWIPNCELFLLTLMPTVSFHGLLWDRACAQFYSYLFEARIGSRWNGCTFGRKVQLSDRLWIRCWINKRKRATEIGCLRIQDSKPSTFEIHHCIPWAFILSPALCVHSFHDVAWTFKACLVCDVLLFSLFPWLFPTTTYQDSFPFVLAEASLLIPAPLTPHHSRVYCLRNWWNFYHYKVNSSCCCCDTLVSTTWHSNRPWRLLSCIHRSAVLNCGPLVLSVCRCTNIHNPNWYSTPLVIDQQRCTTIVQRLSPRGMTYRALCTMLGSS